MRGLDLASGGSNSGFPLAAVRPANRKRGFEWPLHPTIRKHLPLPRRGVRKVPHFSEGCNLSDLIGTNICLLS